MPADNERCPRCHALLEYDEVDIGVGIQRGNYYCPECGWEPRPLMIEEEEEEE